MQADSRTAILAALGANLGIAIAKFVGWGMTGAASMLAEAVHSVADTSNQALLLWGGSAARRQASETHPFGYGMERYFWSFVVALVIFSVGGLFALAEGIEKLRHPHDVANVAWAVGILVVAIGLETFSFHTAIVASRPLKGRSSWMTFIRRSKNPELPVVLLEDLGALLGLVLALAGVGLAYWTGDARWDAVGSIAIGVLLIAIAVTLVVEMKSLLIGESATPEHIDAIGETLASAEDIERIIHMRTMHLGPDHLLVAAKVAFRRGMSFSEVAAAIDAAEDRIRARVPIARTIFVEPDVYKNGPDTGTEA
jgi:cation diffusion facilitator family transporter